eukprot:NODE_7003_length_423_cov_149.887701_g5385_i0.p2 GENE.NODE_7003_length_423_cov_149.887701_g5385_i0~~NODE_7003_length_423_cov_149.887701_g5385_i0.p2  ORF type:complete len:78 (-),score=18.23 NODE_7003_length_423_cov_149.887701_g5385_i0:188-391(-)
MGPRTRRRPGHGCSARISQAARPTCALRAAILAADCVCVYFVVLHLPSVRVRPLLFVSVACVGRGRA